MKKFEGKVAVVTGAASGIEKNKLRVRVRPESIATEWMKRIFPVGIHRRIAQRWEREAVNRNASSEATA